MPPDETTAARGSASRFFAVTCAAGLLAAILFVGFPGIDLAFSSLFYLGDRQFLFSTAGAGSLARQAFNLLFLAACLAALIGIAVSIFRQRLFLRFGFPHWLFIVLTLIVGPGLVANTLFKDNWGRARPSYVQQFGGDLTFTPALVRSDQCARNCSFVAGEAASIYAAFLAFALLARRRRGQLLALAVTAGSLAGLVRIGGGGHFLSDVVFAGVFMALTARALYWLIFEAGARAFAESGPLHRRMSTAGRVTEEKLRRLASRRSRESS